MYLSQLIGQGGDIVSWLVWIIFFMVFFMFYPRIMLSQIMMKLDSSAKKLEKLSDTSRRMLLSEISRKPSKRIKDSVNRFFEFFLIQPVDLDPYGMVKKFDHLIKNEHERFDYFVNQIIPNADDEKKACIKMGFSGGIELYMLSKIVRHYIEMIRKTKSYQIAMLIQMQLPLIEKIAKALFEGTNALSKGKPIGDSIGPWMAARMIGTLKTREVEEGIIMAQKKIDGRRLFILKAKGPGGRIGYPGKAVEKLINKYRIARIVTIDAAAKLEGEKTGSVAEGVGVAMGGPGVERSYIENAVVRKGIPIDSIVVKMSSEEAIKPLRMSMIKAYDNVMDSVKRSIEMTKKGSNLIVVGVGNTSGVGNSSNDCEKTLKWVQSYERKLKSKKKKKG